MIAFVDRQTRIIHALMMREMVTRFGREGLGFLWLAGEPLLFCFGVLFMWSVIKPEYEHGVRLGPFVMTGYMALLLFRHHISAAVGAVQGNIGLLYHRQIQVMHIFLSRNLLEFAGATIAFIVVYVFLIAAGQVASPSDWGLLYSGWLLLVWVSSGLANTLAALSLRYDLMEKLVPVLSYALIPLSGAFFMVDWIPAQYRETYLLIPLPHGIEMVRAGVFGEFVKTHYHPTYAFIWGGALHLASMILLSDARSRVELG